MTETPEDFTAYSDQAADWLRRARRLYQRSTHYQWRGEIRGTPTPETCRVVALEGRIYVVLRDAAQILAVYRVGSDNRFKRLKRWPPLGEADEERA